MDSQLLTLVVALLFAVIVESQPNSNPPPPKISPPPPRLSPKPPRPPPPTSPPPPSTPPPPVSPPPPSTHPRPVSPPPPPPSLSAPPPPLQSPPPSHLPPPPPRKHLRPVLPEHGNQYKNLSPPLEREKPNVGKKIGLMFVGVAAILQVCIVAFLLIRRRQLL